MANLVACSAPSTTLIKYDTAELDAEAAIERELALKQQVLLI
jgi:hypothetical protein